MLAAFKALIKRLLIPFIRAFVTSPFVRRQGQRLLAPFPRFKGWVIRQVQAGKYASFTASQRIEGYGERQQRLSDGLNQRWQRGADTHE